MTTARFLDDVVAACRALDPFVRFVCDAVAVPADQPVDVPVVEVRG